LALNPGGHRRVPDGARRLAGHVSVRGELYLLLYLSAVVAAAVVHAVSRSGCASWVPGLRWIVPPAS
jgi:hypothetical protein